MQDLIGFLILAVIVVVAAIVASENSHRYAEKSAAARALEFLAETVLWVIVAYAILAIIGGIFWVILWLEIVVRSILQWCVEAALAPFSWIF